MQECKRKVSGELLELKRNFLVYGQIRCVCDALKKNEYGFGVNEQPLSPGSKVN